jgi:hypothetical protein
MAPASRSSSDRAAVSSRSAPRPAPLKHDQVADLLAGDLIVRYPRSEHETAVAAVELVGALWPVVESYLGARWSGTLRLELLAEARVSGANPAAATLRHALRGIQARSPASAGVLSYQLGQVLWYAASGESHYRGPAPRCPDWLLVAALTPLTHVWSDRRTWSDHLGRHLQRALRRRPLPEAALEAHAGLPPGLLAQAVSQSISRGQSLAQRHPDWVRTLLARLAADPRADGLTALAAITCADAEAWRERFAADLEAWRAEDDEWRPGVIA